MRSLRARLNLCDQLPSFDKIWYKCYVRPAQPVARGQQGDISNEETSLNPFPDKIQDITPKQY